MASGPAPRQTPQVVPWQVETLARGWLQDDPWPPRPYFRATIDEVETDVVEIEAKLDKVRAGASESGHVGLGCRVRGAGAGGHMYSATLRCY